MWLWLHYHDNYPSPQGRILRFSSQSLQNYQKNLKKCSLCTTYIVICLACSDLQPHSSVLSAAEGLTTGYLYLGRESEDLLDLPCNFSPKRVKKCVKLSWPGHSSNIPLIILASGSRPENKRIVLAH